MLLWSLNNNIKTLDSMRLQFCGRWHSTVGGECVRKQCVHKSSVQRSKRFRNSMKRVCRRAARKSCKPPLSTYTFCPTCGARLGKFYRLSTQALACICTVVCGARVGNEAVAHTPSNIQPAAAPMVSNTQPAQPIRNEPTGTLSMMSISPSANAPSWRSRLSKLRTPKTRTDEESGAPANRSEQYSKWVVSQPYSTLGPVQLQSHAALKRNCGRRSHFLACCQSAHPVTSLLVSAELQAASPHARHCRSLVHNYRRVTEQLLRGKEHAL